LLLQKAAIQYERNNNDCRLSVLSFLQSSHSSTAVCHFSSLLQLCLLALAPDWPRRASTCQGSHGQPPLHAGIAMWYKAYATEATGVHSRPGSAGDLTAIQGAGSPGLRPLSSRGETVPTASNCLAGLSGHMPVTASSPGNGSRSAVHPPPMPSEIEELEPLLAHSPHPKYQQGPGPSASSTDLLSVWGQSWAGSSPKQRVPQRRLVPGGNLDVIISKWNAAWDGAPAKAHQQQLGQPAPKNSTAGPGPGAASSQSSSKGKGDSWDPTPTNLRLRKTGAGAAAGSTGRPGGPTSSSSNRGKDGAAVCACGAAAGSCHPPCSPRIRPVSPAGSSGSSSGRRSPLAALNIHHPHHPAPAATPRLLATAAAAAAATAVLARRPWRRNGWWLAGGLGMAVTSASAVGAAYLVLAYFVKAAAVFSLAWKAATAVAAAEGLCLGSWSYGVAADKEAAAEALTVAQQQHMRDVTALQALLKVEEARRTEAVSRGPVCSWGGLGRAVLCCGVLCRAVLGCAAVMVAHKLQTHGWFLSCTSCPAPIGCMGGAAEAAWRTQRACAVERCGQAPPIYLFVCVH
jgi:hypothetical protein